MSGFFPCMMFGIPGAALAMIRSARSARKKAAAGILGSAALCAFVCGITEPFEFAFMFAAPWLYLVYALLYGLFAWVTALVGFRAAFSFSAGATDLLFSASLPAAQNTWMILPLGLAAFVLFYLSFRVLIRRFDFRTPGREAEELAETARRNAAGAGKGRASGIDAEALLAGLGGAENILSLDNCATRLRLELKEPGLADEAALKAAGAKGIIRPGKNSVQVIIGLKVQAAADELRGILN